MSKYKIQNSIPEINEAMRHRVINKETNKDVKDINEPDTSTRRIENEPAQCEMGETAAPVSEHQMMRDDWTSCDFHNVPPWLQYNDCILSGHRPPLPSYKMCFKSIFRIHNETVNIWTHLLGCLFFIILAISTVIRLSKLQDILVFTPFFAGAILCLGFSFVFHTLHCHSPQVLTLFSRLDYCGISLLITGSFVPWLYFCFYCQFWIKTYYLIQTTTLGLCALTVSLLQQFRKSSSRPLRAAVFSTFGLSAVVPTLHYMAIKGWDSLIIIPLLTIAFLYILGAALYVCRIPEKLIPGKCDIWFHSHQVFHVLVFAATLINYHAITGVYNRSITTKCL